MLYICAIRSPVDEPLYSGSFFLLNLHMEDINKTLL